MTSHFSFVLEAFCENTLPINSAPHSIWLGVGLRKNYTSSLEFAVPVTISGFYSEKHILGTGSRTKASRLDCSGHTQRGHTKVRAGRVQVWKPKAIFSFISTPNEQTQSSADPREEWRLWNNVVRAYPLKELLGSFVEARMEEFGLWFQEPVALKILTNSLQQTLRVPCKF